MFPDFDEKDMSRCKQVSDTTASEKASEKDANEITPSETAPDKTSRVGSESEHES